jgi:hypothetical protein
MSSRFERRAGIRPAITAEVWRPVCISDTIMISILDTTPLSDSTATKKSNKTHSKAKKPGARWGFLIMLFALTAMVGTHQALRFQSSRQWVTISLPNPPEPLLDSTTPSDADRR